MVEENPPDDDQDELRSDGVRSVFKMRKIYNSFLNNSVADSVRMQREVNQYLSGSEPAYNVSNVTTNTDTKLLGTQIEQLSDVSGNLSIVADQLQKLNQSVRTNQRLMRILVFINVVIGGIMIWNIFL